VLHAQLGGVVEGVALMGGGLAHRADAQLLFDQIVEGQRRQHVITGPAGEGRHLRVDIGHVAVTPGTGHDGQAEQGIGPFAVGGR
jgi:hypothetical protein